MCIIPITYVYDGIHIRGVRSFGVVMKRHLLFVILILTEVSGRVGTMGSYNNDIHIF